MLFSELLFYKDDTVIKTVGDEDFSEFGEDVLQEFVMRLVSEIGATKVISKCIYHGEQKGTINRILFPLQR